MNFITSFTALMMSGCVAYLIANGLHDRGWKVILCFILSLLYLSAYCATVGVSQWQLLIFDQIINFWHLIFLPVLLPGIVLPLLAELGKYSALVVLAGSKKLYNRVRSFFQNYTAEEERGPLKTIYIALGILSVLSFVKYLLIG